ncbi:4-hydroxyphenylpyruvate dioxygenase [Longimicrobium sp.]|uniref:4-hydroxyphenylpyruvate dioxygenase n=1 Tax=Longimicrobium sp. TaxID=2029185 RepID=UPI002D1392E2|nr:4-hydroxyphenylpyruvate dioxygenase [Longimicrobium sp.]HSU17562.1 4-hydroxyphenylpyruvate dioxygenase [Longimicrobium sp.]
MATIEQEIQAPVLHGALQLNGIDHVELYVGNAYQAAHFYRAVFGFRPVARAGLETGVRDRMSVVLEQGDVRLVLTSGIAPESEIARHAALHGDGVKDVAFTVDDVEAAFETAVRRGAHGLSEPRVHEDAHGRVLRATIAAPGDTVHSFVERRGYGGAFLPGFDPILGAPATVSTGITEVDHVAVSMEQGELDRWIDFYTDVLGFHQSHHEMVWTKHSAMNSKVVEDASGKVKFPIVEPAQNAEKSQVQEYLNFNRGAGAQHVAFLTPDIRRSVRAIRDNGVNFLKVPPTYYEVLEERVGHLGPEMMAELQELGILVDRDDDGRLMQIFSEPVGSRPTMFIELIERQGALGFGSGNIKALFEAVEREQERRGTI